MCITTECKVWGILMLCSLAVGAFAARTGNLTIAVGCIIICTGFYFLLCRKKVKAT